MDKSKISQIMMHTPIGVSQIKPANGQGLFLCLAALRTPANLQLCSVLSGVFGKEAFCMLAPMYWFLNNH